MSAVIAIFVFVCVGIVLFPHLAYRLTKSRSLKDEPSEGDIFLNKIINYTLEGKFTWDSDPHKDFVIAKCIEEPKIRIHYNWDCPYFFIFFGIEEYTNFKEYEFSPSKLPKEFLNIVKYGSIEKVNVFETLMAHDKENVERQFKEFINKEK